MNIVMMSFCKGYLSTNGFGAILAWWDMGSMRDDIIFVWFTSTVIQTVTFDSMKDGSECGVSMTYIRTGTNRWLK